MALQSRLEKDVAVIEVGGLLSGGKETAEIHEAVKKSVNNRITKIVIDLSRVERMNSLAVGMLMSCFTTVRNANGHFRVAGAERQVLHLLEITKLLNIFSNYYTVKEALKSFPENTS